MAYRWRRRASRRFFNSGRDEGVAAPITHCAGHDDKPDAK
jgi:hypothetical protein